MHHAVGVGRDGGHHRDPAGGNQVAHGIGVDVFDIADQTDVGGHAVDGDAAPHRREQLGVLTGDADRVRAIGVDQADQFPADLTEQHHSGDVEHLGCGDPEATLEITFDTKAFEHRADLRTTAVHHHRVDAAVTQEGHVGGERGLERVVGHGVSAVLDHDDLAVQLLEPRQRFGEDRRLGLGRKLPRGESSCTHELYAEFSST